MRITFAFALLYSVAGPASVLAQASPGPAAEAMQQCVTLADQRNSGEARTAARRAESLFKAQLERQPTDVAALVGLARVISQCLLPAADFMEQGELSTEAIDLLERALEIEPAHWLARFVLASINYRSPAFLGRAPRAAEHFDLLLKQQGDRTDNPRFARVFELRGMLWSRAGQPDSARTLWQRGATLFPADSALRKLLESVVPPPPASAAAAPPALNTVRVVAAASSATGIASSTTVTRSEVLMTPGGGADVLQAVQMQPGATRVSEGSDVYTRGGDANETPILVNGGRVLSLSRFEGLNGGMFGAIEPFVVRAVRYSSGGFSARHGNALSGVIEIETDGRPRETQLRAGLSLVQASATARSAFGKRLGGWISARASNTAPLLATHGRTGEFDGAPHSEEMIASLVASPSPGSELRATAIVERDDARRLISAAGWQGAFHSAGGIEALQLSSRWMSPQAVIIRTSLAASRKSSAWDFGVLSRRLGESSAIGRTDLEWSAAPRMMLRAGLEYAALSLDDAGVLPSTSRVAPGSPRRASTRIERGARHLGAYGETDISHGDATLTLGIRADRLPGEAQVTADPRAALSLRIGAWGARLSGGVFHQGAFRAEPAIPDAGVPSGTATMARHLVAGVEREGTAGTIRAEAYMKRYGNYVARGSGPQITRGDARGVDLIVQSAASAGRLAGWLGYSLLDASMQLSDGREARSPFDVTHSATASGTLTLNADWSVGSTVRYGTGAPITPVTGARTESDGRLAPAYGSVMSDRLPAFARIDARLMRYVRTPAFLLTTYVEVINAASRRNASAVTYDASYRTRQPVHSFFAARTIVAGGEFQFR